MGNPELMAKLIYMVALLTSSIQLTGMEGYGEIYLITNTENGKRYIGQTQCFTAKRRRHGIACRWVEHKRFAKRGNTAPLYEAIRAFGNDVFTIELLLYAPLAALDALEMYFIEQYDTTDPDKGYNVAKGGYSHFRRTKTVQAALAIEQWKDPGFRAMHAAKTKKQWEDPEFREKVSQGVGKATKLRNENPAYKDNHRTKCAAKHALKRAASDLPELPMYVTERKIAGAVAGYCVSLPGRPYKSFTAKSMTMEDKREAAIRWREEQLSTSKSASA